MNELRRENGIALMVTLLIMLVMLGLGVALLSTVKGQQRSAYNESSSETAYSLAEAALNAQIFELSLQWPTSSTAPTGGFPTRCTAASNGTSYCPTPADLSSAYPASGTCPSNTPGDAWNSGTVSNGWTTYVRDAGTTSATQQLFTSSTEESMSAYDASGNGYVWVRAVGIVNCQRAVVVAKVTEQLVTLNFPDYVINANGFETSNNGNKQIVDTQGSAPQPSEISLRCTGLGGTPPNSTCASYGKSAQVSPGPTYAPTPATTPTLSSTQMSQLAAQANSDGTYFAPNVCPTSASQLAGSPVYISGPCNLSFTGNTTINSSASPGFLVIADGTLLLNGTVSYYGVIYDANQQGCPSSSSSYCLNSDGDVVETHGNAQVYGGITVDGDGTINFGSSGAPNLQYYANAFTSLKTFGGADAVPNSFRQLPDNQ